MKPITIFLVDDSQAVRQSLTKLVRHEADLTVCGEAESGSQALEKFPSLKPDVVIVDLSLDDIDGIDLVKKIASKDDEAPSVLVVSMHEESVYGGEVLRAGAKGYLMKTHAAEKIVEAVRTVAKGGIYTGNRSEIFGQNHGSKRKKTSR